MMNDAIPLAKDFGGDASLKGLLATLEPHGEASLIIHYGERVIRPGYHVTEVKAGSFVTLDCGGNPDAWQETILQVEDLSPEGAVEYLSVSKFLAILGQVGRHVVLDADARITFEVGTPGEAMQVYDVGEVRLNASGVELHLVGRVAVCKPRHRAEQYKACCNSGASASSCCAS